MLVKVRIAREGLNAGDAPVDTEVLERESDRAEQAGYYDEAVALFTLMLESIEN